MRILGQETIDICLCRAWGGGVNSPSPTPPPPRPPTTCRTVSNPWRSGGGERGWGSSSSGWMPAHTHTRAPSARVQPGGRAPNGHRDGALCALGEGLYSGKAPARSTLELDRVRWRPPETGDLSHALAWALRSRGCPHALSHLALGRWAECLGSAVSVTAGMRPQMPRYGCREVCVWKG